MNKYFKVKQKFKKNYKILKKKLIKFRVISKKKYVAGGIGINHASR